MIDDDNPNFLWRLPRCIRCRPSNFPGSPQWRGAILNEVGRLKLPLPRERLQPFIPSEVSKYFNTRFYKSEGTVAVPIRAQPYEYVRRSGFCGQCIIENEANSRRSLGPDIGPSGPLKREEPSVFETRPLVGWKIYPRAHAALVGEKGDPTTICSGRGVTR